MFRLGSEFSFGYECNFGCRVRVSMESGFLQGIKVRCGQVIERTSVWLAYYSDLVLGQHFAFSSIDFGTGCGLLIADTLT